MNKTINLIFAMTLLTFCFGFRSEDRIKFYWGDKEVNPEEGISITLIRESDPVSCLHFFIQKELEPKLSNHVTKVEYSLVRNRQRVHGFRSKEIYGNHTIFSDKLKKTARVGDTILIQFLGTGDVIPKIIGLKIKE